MCGIAGISTRPDRGADPGPLLKRMVDSLRLRGPDDQGRFVDGNVGIGMTRLSIIDLEGGHQPISSEDGSVTVVCNGEIYNHEELRRDLQNKGHVFKTGSDVEVLVHLYEEDGVDCLQRLRGMFGFAVWDSRRRRLFVARDRLGIKPLVYTLKDGNLLFGSELKALLVSGLLDTQIDWRALDLYLRLGYIPSPHTIYDGVKKLDPGHYFLWEDDRLVVERYWDLKFSPRVGVKEQTVIDEFVDLFSSTVESHLMSDVPLGAFLSGGVDSSLVVAVMSQFSDSPVRTFTMGFGGDRGGYLDERQYARLVSQRYGTDHTEYEVCPSLTDIMDSIVCAFDEPFADDSVIPTYYICKLAREKVKVALTGLGGDELFGGYERYLGLKLSQYYDWIPGALRRRVIDPIVNRLPELKNGHYTINHMKRFVRSSRLQPARRYRQYMSIFDRDGQQALLHPDVFEQIQDSRRGQADEILSYFTSDQASDLLNKALYTDTKTYLPEDILALTDRLSMHHSLELRVPFVDHKLVEFCATVPTKLKIKGLTKKYMLKKASRKYLPAEVIDHRKQGFAAPMAAWLRNDLRDYVFDSLSESRLSQHGFMDPQKIKSMIEDHLSRKELNSQKIFSVLMFQKWYESYVTGKPCFGTLPELSST